MTLRERNKILEEITWEKRRKSKNERQMKNEMGPTFLIKKFGVKMKKKEVFSLVHLSKKNVKKLGNGEGGKTTLLKPSSNTLKAQ